MDDPREQVAGVFDRSAPTYDAVGVTFFGDVGARVVELAALRPGERVVDMGCGRGAALFPAAEAVGPTGSAHWASTSRRRWSQLTRADARVRGLPQVSVEVGDAQEPGLTSGWYDVVLSSLAVFFLPDPAAGLRAWRDAAVEGGRLALSTFAARDDPRWEWLDEIFPCRDPAGDQRRTPTRRTPGRSAPTSGCTTCSPRRLERGVVDPEVSTTRGSTTPTSGCGGRGRTACGCTGNG